MATPHKPSKHQKVFGKCWTAVKFDNNNNKNIVVGWMGRQDEEIISDDADDNDNLEEKQE